MNLAGPASRDVLARVTDLDVSREALPYLAAVEAVERAAKAAGKAAGVLLRKPEELDGYRARGFQLIGISGDGAFLAGAARAAVEGLQAR
jgi:2-keto-3-deoxy-L-rhamnonate aldolase RhmA